MAALNLSQYEIYQEIIKRGRAGAFVYLPVFLLISSSYDFWQKAPWSSGALLLAFGLTLGLRIWVQNKDQQRVAGFERILIFKITVVAGAVLWSMFFLLSFSLFGLQDATMPIMLASAGIIGGLLASFSPALRMLYVLQAIFLFPLMVASFSLFSREGWSYLAIVTIYYAFMVTQARVMNREILQTWNASKALEDSNKTLQEARDMALKASKLKSEFVANISHEIRTPLNGVIGMIQLIRSTPLNAEQKEFLRTIESCGASLMYIINDILDYSKIEAGKMDFDFQPCSLKELTEEALATLGSLHSKSQVQILFDIADNVPAHIITDKTRLKQIITNLMTNSLKFTEKGFVRLDVQLLHKQADELTLQFHVEDTGAGIPHDVQKELFKPFTQGDNSVTRKHGGTGLGLVICQRICEMLGGEIWFESYPGIGTQFFFTIKAKLGKPQAEPLPAEHLISYKKNTNLRALVVEDNKVNQFLVEKLLTKIGFTVTLANHGQECLDHFEPNKFDVILMDLQMPFIDGYEATRFLVKSYSRDELPPIIALTASAVRGEKEKCIEAGMTDYLSKPIDIARLHQVLNSALGGLGGSVDTKSLAPGPVINFQQFNKYVDGDPAMAIDIVNVFLNNSYSKVFFALEEAVRKADFDEIARLSHTYRGSVGIFGHGQMTQAVTDLELAAREGDLSKVKNIFTSVSSQSHKLVEELMHFLKQSA